MTYLDLSGPEGNFQIKSGNLYFKIENCDLMIKKKKSSYTFKRVQNLTSLQACFHNHCCIVISIQKTNDPGERRNFTRCYNSTIFYNDKIAGENIKYERIWKIFEPGAKDGVKKRQLHRR